MKSKNASLKDVAELAGVSFTLVSKYLTNNPQARMSPETKERIDNAIRKLNYRPSATARSLRYGRSHTIGFISTNLTNPYHAHVVDLALRLARTKGYQLLIALDEVSNGDAELIERLFASEVDGILLCGNMVLTGRPTCPISIYDGAAKEVFHLGPDIMQPLADAMQNTGGSVGGLFFQRNWEEAFIATTRELNREAYMLHCPIPLEERKEAIRKFLGEHRPELLITSGWHTLTMITEMFLPEMPDYNPRIVCQANCTGPFFDEPHIQGVIYSSTTELIRHSLDLLLAQIEDREQDEINPLIPARYVSADDPEYRNFITREFHLT